MLNQGEEIDNPTLCDLFSVANAGGMRRSLAQNHLVLVADWTKGGGVQNRWDGEVLHFVGQGQGNQVLAKQNRTLARSPVTGERVHLFEVHQPGRYTYRGRVELAGEPFQEEQPDRNGEPRMVWVFPLRVVSPDTVAPTSSTRAAGPPVPPVAYLPAGTYAVIRDGIKPDAMKEVHSLLDRLRAAGAVVLDRRDIEDGRYQAGLGRWYDRVMADIRRTARGRVRDLKKRHRLERRTWVFGSDETEIDDRADEDRVRHVLDFVGIGDEFERIRQAAYDRAEHPVPPDHYEPDAPMTDEEVAEFRQIAAKLRAR